MEHIAITYIRACALLWARRACASSSRSSSRPAAPHIVAGLRMGAALAFLSLVAAELTGASAGIGFRLQEARQFIRTDRMFVGLIELGMLGALLDLIFVMLSRRLVHWEHL
jgi:NitT/TauT family transport system permease protein